MWKGNKTKYTDVEEYIKSNENNFKLIEFETTLKKRFESEYLLYKFRFKQKLSYSQISKKLEIDTPRIAEKLDKIGFAIKIYCNI